MIRIVNGRTIFKEIILIILKMSTIEIKIVAIPLNNLITTSKLNPTHSTYTGHTKYLPQCRNPIFYLTNRSHVGSELVTVQAVQLHALSNDQLL